MTDPSVDELTDEEWDGLWERYVDPDVPPPPLPSPETLDEAMHALWLDLAELLRLPQLAAWLGDRLERHPRLFHALGGRTPSPGCDPNPMPPRFHLFRTPRRSTR